MAGGGITAAAQNRDRAEAGVLERAAPVEIGARHERARAGIPGPLQARAHERRAPRHLVAEAAAFTNVAKIGEDVRVIGGAPDLALPELGPSTREPLRLIHGGLLSD